MTIAVSLTLPISQDEIKEKILELCGEYRRLLEESRQVSEMIEALRKFCEHDFDHKTAACKKCAARQPYSSDDHY